MTKVFEVVLAPAADKSRFSHDRSDVDIIVRACTGNWRTGVSDVGPPLRQGNAGKLSPRIRTGMSGT